MKYPLSEKTGMLQSAALRASPSLSWIAGLMAQSRGGEAQ